MLVGQAQLSQSVPNYRRLISFTFDEDSSHHSVHALMIH